MGNDEDIPYLTALPAQNPVGTPSFSTDEANYDTLKYVHKILQDAARDLTKDFNLLNIPVEQLVTDHVVAMALVRQISAKQEAYAIIAPLLESVETAISVADDKYKQRNQS